MSANLGSQQLSSDKQGAQMESSSNNQSTIPVNLGLQQLSSTAKQSKQVEMIPWFHSTMPVNFGSQQLSTSEKHQAQTRGQVPLPVNLGAYPLQSIPMQPPLHAQTNMPVFFGLQQLSSTNRRPSAIQPLHYVQASTSSKNRRPVQIDASPKFQKSISANLGSPQPLSTSKRPSQVEPSLKVQTESLESVRSKLRESLTSALSMVSEKQNKSQNVEKASPGDASSRENQAEMGTQPVELPSVATDASLRGTSETLTLNEQCQKHDEGQDLSCDLGSNENTSDTPEILKSDEQKSQLQHVPLDDKMLFRSDSVIKDELLLGHGLCWASDIDAESSEVMLNHDRKRPKLIQVGVSENNNKTVHQSSENLAAKIEAELYKLFGGVNKKYKEKARSLLFNLKDPSNPELRDRVISGDIAPGRLCSMTAEELASKELSEWRLAKAEELAHMVVLQDSEVDIRRLVRKTHKGEFQVEVEHDDGTSVEVGVGTDILTQIPTKAKANEKVQTQVKSTDTGRILSKPSETKAPEGLQLPEKADAGDQKISSNVDTLAQERTDLMQEFMVDELKDTELLPPIVSLDEFMEALDKEPPFVNLDNEQDIPSSAERNSDSSVPEMSPASDKPEPKMDLASDSLGSKLYSLQDSLVSKVDPADTIQENFEEIAKDDTDKVDDKDARNDSTLIAGSVHVQTDNYLRDTSSKSENIWEGMVQFNISAPAMVICFFKSGERTSTQEWPNFLEIKGRVRLDAFEKFLQELPLSRSRAIMIAQLCWKEGSPETGRLHLMEAVNSYIVDERVGFAEPAAGVELYLCPSHTKTTEILSKHLSKDEAEEGLHRGSADAAGLVAVVVWRRPHATTVSPRLSKHHHKHKKQGGSRKQQDEATEPPPPSRPDEVIDDVPPGFGPPRDDDDLPEFDFVCTNSSRMAPVEQMRELVHMYGDGGGKRTLQVRSWNDDEDDDIPEWRPKPPPPPPPPIQQQQQLHVYQHPGVAMSQQQHMMPPQLQLQHMMPMQPQQQQQQQQQHMMPMQPQLQQQQQHMMSMQPQQQQLPFALPMQHHQLGVIHPGWQWWPQPCGPADVILPMMINGVMQPCQFGGGQMSQVAPAYGMPGSVQNSAMMMGWRPDNPRGG